MRAKWKTAFSDYLSLKQIIHLSTNFSAFFCGFWIYPTDLLCTSLEVDWLDFFRATSLEMQYLDRRVFRILYVHRLTECKQC
jgi:hypothetical protein